MTGSTWPERLSDGTVVVALHVQGERADIRELVALVVGQWVAYEQRHGQPLPEGLTTQPAVEAHDGGGADVIFVSQAESVPWHRALTGFGMWMAIHSRGLRIVAIEDRIGGESRKPLIISA